MENIKIITRDTIPCWYELSWRGKAGIVLRIHSDFADRTRPIPPDAPIIQHFIQHFGKEFGFQQVGLEFRKDFGFERVLKFLRESNGFLEYAIPAFLCRKHTGRLCQYCQGTGKDENLSRKCISCDGKGEEIVYDYKEAFAVSASITTLFEFMRFPEFETSSPLPQLMCVNTVTICDSHGGSLGGEYSRELVSYLRSRPTGEIPEIVAAMRAVFRKMDGRLPKFYDFSFQAYTQGSNGWLNISCPGEAAGLHPDINSIRSCGEGERGYEFSCHNVDTPAQQLILLASLAVLHDLAREVRK